MTNLDSVLKSRDITLLTKIHIVKATIFPVVLYRRESWTIKKAEHPRIDAFELWCWRRLLRVPWTAKRSNQSILKKSTLNIHWKDWCWCSNILWPPDVKRWLTGRTYSLEKILMLGNIEGRRRRGNRGWDGWMASLTQRTWVWANSGIWCRTGKTGMLQAGHFGHCTKTSLESTKWSICCTSPPVCYCWSVCLSWQQAMWMPVKTKQPFVLHVTVQTETAWSQCGQRSQVNRTLQNRE